MILHGWGSSPDRWQNLRDALVECGIEKRQIFIPALPGFGQKELPTPYDVDDYAAWLARYFDENHIKKPVLVGHSNGGRIAIRFCATEGDVAQLVLIGAAGIPNPHLSTKRVVFGALAAAGKKVLSPLKNTPLYSAAEKILYKLARESDYFKASPVMKHTMQKLLAYDATPDLKKIACPVLCIWGKDDTATPVWMGKKIADEVANGTLKVVEGGHTLQGCDPSRVASLICHT